MIVQQLSGLLFEPPCRPSYPR